MNYLRIGQVRFSHHEEEINRFLEDGWFILDKPFVGLRRVLNNQDGRIDLIDIPYREATLGKWREEKDFQSIKSGERKSSRLKDDE